MWVTDGSSVKAFPISAVLPTSTAERDDDYMNLLRNVVPADSDSTSSIQLVEEFTVSDSRASLPDCIDAVKQELDGLIRREEFKLISKKDLPSSAKVLGGRIIRCVKNVGTGEEKFKARFVVQGHRDPEKSFRVHYCATLRQTSLRVVMSLTATFEIEVWSVDVNQAYTSSRPTTRNIYVRLGPAFGLSGDTIFQFIKPLYGLSDAGDAWWRTLRSFLVDEMNLLQCVSDPCLLYLPDYSLPNLVGVYVDDLLFAGGARMEEISKTLRVRFPSKPASHLAFSFSGYSVTRSAEYLHLGLPSYCSSIAPLEEDASFYPFRRL